MSYDFNDTKNQNNDAESQSLWNRAMSYDAATVTSLGVVLLSLNPFGTGQCLTTVVGS